MQDIGCAPNSTNVPFNLSNNPMTGVRGIGANAHQKWELDPMY
jgi:hypothetical protein